MLTIDTVRCIRCGLCELICPNSAIKAGQLDNSACIHCSQCRESCPESAIGLKA